MAITQTFTRGVKYIKVSKIDANGNDLTTELQNVDNIRLLFSDIQIPVDYIIGSVTEYSSYYLYGIIPTDITSSTDNTIINNSVTASSQNFGTGASPVQFNAIPYFSTNWTAPVNANSVFNTTYGSYFYTGSSNILLDFTCSVTYSNQPGTGNNGSIGLYQMSGNTPIAPPYTNSVVQNVSYKTLSNIGGSTTSTTFSGSFIPFSNTNYQFLLGSPTAVNQLTMSVSITQSVNPQSYANTTLTVLEPFIDDDFYNSDCNVLQNNVDINNTNNFYMVVDYSNGSIVAENQQAILNGSATRAQVQSWNYTYKSSVRSKYEGKQQNAIDINYYTGATQFVSGSTSPLGYTGSWPGDTTSPLVKGSTVIQLLDSCIYEYSWIGGGYPENEKGGGISLGNLYLVGDTKDDVQVIRPDQDLYYDILMANIPNVSNVLIHPYSPTPILPSTLQVAYSAVEIPSAQYYLDSYFYVFGPSTNSNYLIFCPTGSYFVPYPFIQWAQGTLLPGVTKDINNNLVRATNNAYFDQVAEQMISDIASGSAQWYVSLYSGSGTSVVGTGSDGYDIALTPPQSDLITGLYTSSYGQNLSQYGLPFKVISVDDQSQFLTLATGSDITNNVVKYYSSSSFNNNNTSNNIFLGATQIGAQYISSPSPFSNSIQAGIGMLLTRTPTPSSVLTVYGYPWTTFSNKGPGYLTTPYPKAVITQNAEYITKTYGNNPN
jgi:hypothetical protein